MASLTDVDGHGSSGKPACRDSISTKKDDILNMTKCNAFPYNGHQNASLEDAATNPGYKRNTRRKCTGRQGYIVAN